MKKEQKGQKVVQNIADEILHHIAQNHLILEERKRKLKTRIQELF